MDYEAMKKLLRNWSTQGESAYDFNGVVHLMLACLDNLRQFGLEAEFEDIACSFAPDQAEFFIKLAGIVEAGRPWSDED